jgi:hypothetical protein
VTTTEDKSRPAWQGPQAPVSNGRPIKSPPLLTHKRRQQPVIAIAMLVAAVVFAGIGAWQYSSATKGQQVLVATGTIPAGTRLSASDVTIETVRLPSSLPHVDAAYLSSIGKYWATATIPAGGLLMSAQLTNSAPSSQPTSEVGLVLSTQQRPATLTPGETIECIYTGTQGSQGAAGGTVATPLGAPTAPVPFSQLVPGQEITTATVLDVPAAPSTAGGPFSSASPTGTNTADITVSVPEPYAQTLAAAAAATQVAIVAAPGSSGS